LVRDKHRFGTESATSPPYKRLPDGDDYALKFFLKFFEAYGIKERSFSGGRDESEATADHARKLAIETSFWRQKSSIKWLQSGAKDDDIQIMEHDLRSLQDNRALLICSPLSSPRKKTKSGRHSRRSSAGNVREVETTLQQFKDFQGELSHRLAAFGMVDIDCPRSALIDARDIELLNKLVKKKVGRPPKSKRNRISDSSTRYGLRSNANKSNSFLDLEYTGGVP